MTDIGSMVGGEGVGMNELTVTKSGALTDFKPERHRLKVAAIDYGIEEAKRIKNWPALIEAVEQKIREQKQFIGWWDACVRGAGQPRKELSGSADNSLAASEAQEATGMSPQRVSDLRKDLAKTDKYRDKLLGKEFVASHLQDPHVRGTLGTGENEWYTPQKYIELAREVLGGIDLDPASSDIAQRTVKASNYFTKEINGLTREWRGRVWLNPPYAQPYISQFVEKMIAERSEGRVSAAIMLTHNYTDTSWFHEAAEIVDAICFTRGRVKFLDAEGGDCAPTQGQAFFYFGDDVARFAAKFLSVGFVMVGA